VPSGIPHPLPCRIIARAVTGDKWKLNLCCHPLESPPAIPVMRYPIPMVTVHKTVAAIVERSFPVCVSLKGVLTLLPGADGRYRLAEDHSNDHATHRVPRVPKNA
jgi:hypothetical protein